MAQQYEIQTVNHRSLHCDLQLVNLSSRFAHTHTDNRLLFYFKIVVTAARHNVLFPSKECRNEMNVSISIATEPKQFNIKQQWQRCRTAKHGTEK